VKAFALASLFVFATGSAMAANADFVLVNKTGYDINEVYISPANKKNWGQDKLGEYQFLKNQSRKFKFGDTRNCKQDIKVVFTEDESEVEWNDINLCEIDKITLRYNKRTQEVSAELD
jgi:hypothetical protein